MSMQHTLGQWLELSWLVGWLVERSLLIPEVSDSNPSNGKILKSAYFSVKC